MRKTAFLTTLAVLFAAPVFAQGTGAASQPNTAQPMHGHGGMDHGASDGSADLSILPQGCRDAVQDTAMSRMMEGMDMSGMMGGMEGMDEAQRGYMDSMMVMHAPMMAAHTIEDPDLAFHCGMIAHHAGAIAMAEVELEHGQNDDAKARAQQIIDDQRREIDEMTAWVEENAGQ